MAKTPQDFERHHLDEWLPAAVLEQRDRDLEPDAQLDDATEARRLAGLERTVLGATPHPRP